MTIIKKEPNGIFKTRKMYLKLKKKYCLNCRMEAKEELVNYR